VHIKDDQMLWLREGPVQIAPAGNREHCGK